jgi:hypothetical protein
MSADWIELVQDRAQWWTFVNMIISFQIPWKQGISWPAE